MDLKNISGSQPALESNTPPKLMEDLPMYMLEIAVEKMQTPIPSGGLNIHSPRAPVKSPGFLEGMKGVATSALENVAHVLSYSEDMMEGIESTGAWWHGTKQQGLAPYINAVSDVDAGAGVASDMLKKVELPSVSGISKRAGLLNATFGVLDVTEAVHKDKVEGDSFHIGTIKEITMQVGMNTIGGVIGFAAASVVAGGTTIALAPITVGVVVGVGVSAAVRAGHNWMFSE